MGGKSSHLTRDEIKDYKELTYFTKNEILHIFKRFKELSPRELDVDPQVRLPWSKILNLPELKQNPFGDRLCYVFSSQRDGHLSFEDFLDMVHVLSDYTPIRTKAAYAFAMFDFDNDGVISADDLIILVNRLIGDDHKFTDREMHHLIDTILDEVGIDEDGVLELLEFERVAMKSDNFKQCFRLII